MRIWRKPMRRSKPPGGHTERRNRGGEKLAQPREELAPLPSPHQARQGHPPLRRTHGPRPPQPRLRQRLRQLKLLILLPLVPGRAWAACLEIVRRWRKSDWQDKLLVRLDRPARHHQRQPLPRVQPRQIVQAKSQHSVICELKRSSQVEVLTIRQRHPHQLLHLDNCPLPTTLCSPLVHSPLMPLASTIPMAS